MLRTTLITLTAIAALGVGSAAMAMHGGGGGGGHGGGGGGGGFGGGGAAAMHGAGAGPMMMHGGSMGRAGPMTAAPIAGGRVQGWGGRTAWGFHDRFHDHFHDHFHFRHHNRFFAFGFGGPIYDYAYGSCWTRVPSYYGWRWVYICGDYTY